MATPNFSQLLHNPIHFLAFGFGSGLAPKAPGTFGTLVAVPIFWCIQDWPAIYYGLWILISFAVGVYLCDRSAKQLGVHDHSGIVWDEMVGYWATMMWAPPGWLWIGLGFVFFRFFDIVKPWPINWADRRVAGGLGIMLDDLLAALYAGLVMQAISYVVLSH